MHIIVIGQLERSTQHIMTWIKMTNILAGSGLSGEDLVLVYYEV